MPGQRKKGKVKTGFYLDENERRLLREIADAQGIDKTEFIRRIIRENAKKEGLIK